MQRLMKNMVGVVKSGSTVSENRDDAAIKKCHCISFEVKIRAMRNRAIKIR